MPLLTSILTSTRRFSARPSAVFTKLRAHCGAAGRVGIAHHFDDVSLETSGGLRQPLQLFLVSRRDGGAPDFEFQGGFALHVIFAQSAKSISVLLNILDIGGDLLLIGRDILLVGFNALYVGRDLLCGRSSRPFLGRRHPP